MAPRPTPGRHSTAARSIPSGASTGRPARACTTTSVTCGSDRRWPTFSSERRTRRQTYLTMTPLTFFVIALLFAMAALLACCLPARRFRKVVDCGVVGQREEGVERAVLARRLRALKIGLAH